MKRVWETEELVEHWTLMPPELELLGNKAGANRLGFALLLKFFQHEARFPKAPHEVPDPVINYIAKQVQVPPEHYSQYDWAGRAIKYARVEIRKLHGFREATIEDANVLSQWLRKQILPNERDYEHLRVIVYQRCRELKIEPPTPERIDRIVRSAMKAYEENFCAGRLSRLSPENQKLLDALLQSSFNEESDRTVGNENRSDIQRTIWQTLKADPGRASADTMFEEIAKLERLRVLKLPGDLFVDVPRKVLQGYRQRAAVEEPYELRRHPPALRFTLLAAFCHLRMREISDTLVDVLLEIVHRLSVKAERKVERELLEDLKKVTSKTNLLFRLADATLENPDGIVREVVYPVVPEQTLRELVKEWRANGPAYRRKVTVLMRNSYRSHYRRMLPKLLATLEFRSNNDRHRPVIAALEIIKRYVDRKVRMYPDDDEVPLDGVVKKSRLDAVLETDALGNIRINRINYELCALQTLRERLRCKEVWVVGADRYRNPDEDLPADFEVQRVGYYEALRLPLDADSFIAKLQQEMRDALSMLDQGLPKNPYVGILAKNKGWISLSPLDAQPEPLSLLMLKSEMGQRWQMTSLLDMLKEADFRIGITDTFKSPTAWESLERSVLQPRLLLCLYGLGTNTGLKRMSADELGISYKDLLYIRRRFINKDHLRNAIREVVNAIFRARHPGIWGEGTTACASDSKKFGAYDQNLLTEWHVRYGGRGKQLGKSNAVF
jgi:Tn3 transposase DDE domain/Domain of unknown function (DUF4158)